VVLAVSGSRRVRGSTHVARNVGDVERLLSIACGSALVLSASHRRGAARAILAFIGGELMRRGATGRCTMYEALGISTASDGFPLTTDRATHDFASRAATVDAREAVKLERTIHVARSPADLYAYWRDFRNHSRFMAYVDSVEIKSATRSHWTMTIGGRCVEWDSEVINEIPYELIAWKTVGDSDVAHAGSVHFREVADGTVVRLVVAYEPPGGRPGRLLTQALGMTPEQLADQNLVNFRNLMEARDSAGRQTVTLSGER
jgi:uncharacterized membrane protein